MKSRPPRPERGSTIVVAVVLIGVLTIVALGMVRRSVVEMESATAKRHYDTALSCAEGAREMLLGHFRTYGVVLTGLDLDRVVGTKRYASGHYDRFGLKTVEAVDRSVVGGGNNGALDLVNRSSRVALGGAAYRVTVVCSDSSTANRQSEVEFLVRFGL